MLNDCSDARSRTMTARGSALDDAEDDGTGGDLDGSWVIEVLHLCKKCLPGVCVAGFGGTEDQHEYLKLSVLSKAWLQLIPEGRMYHYHMIATAAKQRANARFRVDKSKKAGPPWTYGRS